MLNDCRAHNKLKLKLKKKKTLKTSIKYVSVCYAEQTNSVGFTLRTTIKTSEWNTGRETNLRRSRMIPSAALFDYLHKH